MPGAAGERRGLLPCGNILRVATGRGQYGHLLDKVAAPAYFFSSASG